MASIITHCQKVISPEESPLPELPAVQTRITANHFNWLTCAHCNFTALRRNIQISVDSQDEQISIIFQATYFLISML